MKALEDLITLIRCHSTPGDEEEVRSFLISKWKEKNLHITKHGQYALSAKSKTHRSPSILVCAHMDSPGYIIDEIHGKRIQAIKLGGPRFEGNTTKALLKTRREKIPVLLEKKIIDEQESYVVFSDAPVTHGDRICFFPTHSITDGKIYSPFLDNRLGCWVLGELSKKEEWMEHVILGATTREEVGCVGAPVLAREISPDIVICLDATYANPRQNVLLGGGPVITLSDNSILLSSKMRDAWIDIFRDANIPLQTEVYNYSGTDAKAFPLIGLSSPVLALLLATENNHSPCEIASIDDLFLLPKAIKALIDRFQTKEAIEFFREL